MVHNEEQMVALLTEVKDATVPSKEGFWKAMNAVPSYAPEPVKREPGFLAPFTVIAGNLVKTGYREFKNVTILTGTGALVVGEFALITTPRAIGRLATKAWKTVEKVVR